jgi:hypothetical protein
MHFALSKQKIDGEERLNISLSYTLCFTGIAYHTPAS